MSRDGPLIKFFDELGTMLIVQRCLTHPHKERTNTFLEQTSFEVHIVELDSQIVWFLPVASFSFHSLPPTSPTSTAHQKHNKSHRTAHTPTTIMYFELIEEYTCGHSYSIKTQRKESYEAGFEHSNHRQFLIDLPKQNLFSKLLRTSSASKATQMKPRYKRFDKLCHKCELKENELRSFLQAKAGPWDLAEVRAQQKQRAQNAIRDGKEYFLCSKCTKERLPLIYGAHRAANNGLCCEIGRKEWEEMEKLTRSERASTLFGHPLPARANSQPVQNANSTSRKASENASPGYFELRLSQDQALLGHSISTRGMREVRAIRFNPQRSQTQSNNRDVDFGPKRGHNFSRIPGYVRPTQTTEQGTYYTEPGIDLSRWESHPRTNHGRYPIPDPAPKKPLPVLPQDKRRPDLSQRKPVPRTPAPAQQVSEPKAPRRQEQFTRSQSSQYETPTQHRHRHGSTKPPRPQLSLSTPQYPLRSSRGKSWRDSADLAARSPATPNTPSMATTPSAPSHRLKDPFSQPFQMDSQDIGIHRLIGPFDQPFVPASQDVSPLTSAPAPFSAVSPMNNSRFADSPTIPRGQSFRAQASSSRGRSTTQGYTPGDLHRNFGQAMQGLDRVAAEVSRAQAVHRREPPRESPLMVPLENPVDDLDRAFNDAFRMAEHWEKDLKGEPRQRRR
jgi:hypothetical protein